MKRSKSKGKKKLKKKIFIIPSVILLVVILVIIGFQINSSFAIAAVGTTSDYTTSGRTSGKKVTSSSNVKIDKLIPDEYELGIGYEPGLSCNLKGGISLSEAEKEAWLGKIRDSVVLKTTSNDSFEGLDSGLNINPRSGKIGELSMYCSNIGTYKGTPVDVRLSIVDYEKANSSDTTYRPLIGVYNPEYSNGKLGFYAGNINWVEVQYEFCKSATYDETGTYCNDPISIKGHISYNDVDFEQGVHLLDNNKGIYARSNSKLSVSTLNSVPYVYSTDNSDKEGLYNPQSSFTETFEGESLTRVYTFASKNGASIDSSGGIWNTDVVSGASVEYDTESNGNLGRAVAKGDKLKYNVVYTNDDITNSNTITIKSVISKGLRYVKGSSTLGDPTSTTSNDGTTTLTWTVNMPKNSVDTMTYSVKVSDEDVGMVSNNVSISSSNGSEYNNIAVLRNSVPNKSYDASTNYGEEGKDVSPGNKIKYNVKYANVYDTVKTITITETLSKYLTYVKNSSNIGEPVITKNNDGTTSLVWTRTLAEAVEETLTYQAEVDSDAKDGSKVSSSTVIDIEDIETINLKGLTNNIVVEVPKEVKKEEEYEPTVDSPGTIAMLIRDSYTKKPVKNAKYIIYNDDNRTIATDTHGNYLENKQTDENGVVEWNEVPYGKYILKEVEPSNVFKSGFYEDNSRDKKLINSIKFTFSEDTDALKWYREGKTKGGSDSGEPFIEREHVKLGDINSDGLIDAQDLTLINAIYIGSVETSSNKEKIKYLISADVDNGGKCNDGNCKITRNDIKLLESYINNPNGNQFESFKTVYLKDSYQKRAALSLYTVPLDLKISNLEYDTVKKIKDAKFVIKDSSGTVYGNVIMNDAVQSIYLPVGTYTIKQEESGFGYQKYENEITIAINKEGNVTLDKDYKKYVKLEKSDDGDIDYLMIYNQIGDIEIPVPYLEQSEQTAARRVSQVATTTGGSAMVVGAAAASFARYGFSLRFFLFKWKRKKEDEVETE